MTSVFHKNTYLKTVLEKVVQMIFFDIVNKDNSLEDNICDTKKLYESVVETHQSNGSRNAVVSSELDILSKPAVCGVINNDGQLYVCYQQSCMKPIYLYPLEFDDSEGNIC